MAILKFELEKNQDENWSFASAGILQIQEDFVLLRDYNSPRHTDQLRLLAARWGAFFLDDAEGAALEKVSSEERPDWLLEKTKNQLHPCGTTSCRSVGPSKKARIICQHRTHIGWD